MTHQQILVVIVEVHTVTLAVLPHLTVGALTLLGPCSIAELLEAILPHVPEVILIDVALRKVGTHACATRYVAIHANRGYTNTRIALERIGANAHLVATQEALTAVRHLHTPLLITLLDKLHKQRKLLVVKL